MFSIFAEYTDFLAKVFCLLLFLDFRMSLSHSPLPWRHQLQKTTLQPFYHKEQLGSEGLFISGKAGCPNSTLGMCKLLMPG